jgi:two-component system, NtrC family, sensor kinase
VQVRKIRVAIEQGKEEQVVIKNYRKDGSMFWNRLQIAPIRNSVGRITLIVSLQYEVSLQGTALYYTV